MSIKSVELWDVYMRGLHWSLALLTLFLSISGWLMGQLLADVSFWSEWHDIAGQTLGLLIVARLVLFFKKGSGHFSRLFVTLKDVPKILNTLKFYVLLGKTELPSWLFSNPLWRLLYWSFYALLLLSVVSGFIDANTLWLGIYWPSLHETVAWWINLWLVLHVLSVFVHDWKGKVNRISAMVNGIAYFEARAFEPQKQETVIKTNFNKPS